MKKTALIFILIGIILCAFAIIGTVQRLFSKSLQVQLVVIGVPLICLGVGLFHINKDQAKRKRPTIVILAISLILIAFGLVSQFMLHIPGARIEIILGTFLFCFGFGPLLTKFRYEKWAKYVGSKIMARALSITDMISLIAIFVGFLFKLQMWPGATFLIYGGFALLPITMLQWNRILGQQLVFRKTAEEKLSDAHHELKEKAAEILDSITYAKRIQTAILPPDKMMRELLPDSFVLYLPKDVVAGDFYWIHKLDNKVLVAAADCTGHGVPGAMVSVVCNNALNRSVDEFKQVSPAKILDKTREIVIKEFAKSEEDVKDGMDIALCAIEGLNLEYAGAHNPLWIVRNNEILEFKADKQPIGNFEMAKPFTEHKIELQKEDVIYIFSDGIVDQFGGENLPAGRQGGKKFKPKQLRELLLAVHSLPMNEQKSRIDEAILNWRNSIEQVDDVCIIGVKI